MLIVSPLIVFGQTDVAAALQNLNKPQPSIQLADPNGNLPWQPIGPDDLVAVSVTDSPEMSRAYRVNENGGLHLPLIKTEIPVKGLKPPEIEARIAQALRDEGLLVNPVVAVAVVEYRGRPINVIGAVHHPISFPALGEVHLFDAIAKAEGLAPEAGPEIVITTTESTAGSSRTQLSRRVLVRDLLSGKNATANIQLQGGDEVLIPEADKVYVVGNVKGPGAFPVHDDVETTVLKVLAQAQGLMPFSTNEAFVYRLGGDGKTRVEIPIQLKQILQRKKADVPLVANDVLYIPENSRKRLTAGMLEGITGIGATLAIFKL